MFQSSFEPAIRSAARQLIPTPRQLDSRGRDQDDIAQDLRIRAFEVERKAQRDINNTAAYVQRSITNAKTDMGRRNIHSDKYRPEYTDYETTEDLRGPERQLYMREVLRRIQEHIGDENMAQLATLIDGHSRHNRSRTTEYRHCAALLKQIRGFLESMGIDSESLGFSIEDVPKRIARRVKYRLALAPQRRILNSNQSHAVCACFRCLEVEQPRKIDEDAQETSSCGTLAGVVSIKLEDGNIIEIGGQPSRRGNGRKKRYRVPYGREEEHASVFSSLGLEGLSASPRKSGGSKGSADGGGSTGNGSGHGPPGGPTCIACEGTGKSSKGSTCSPCRGTGTALAAASDLPDHQHPTISGDNNKQTDLFTPKTRVVDAVGRAHDDGAVDAGADAKPESGQRRRRRKPVAGVEGKGVETDVSAGVLAAERRPEVPDNVRSDVGDNGRRDVQSSEGERAPQAGGQGPGHEQLERPEVLGSVDKQAEPREQAGGYVVNLATASIERVDWKGVVPLCRTPDGYNVLQFDYWSPVRNCWVWLVAQHTGRKVPDGVNEVTLDEWLAYDRKQHMPGQSQFPIAIEGWKSGLPLLTSSKGPIHQITYWSAPLQRWLIVTMGEMADSWVPQGCVNLGIDGFFRLVRHLKAGMAPQEAYNKSRDNVPF